MAGPGLPTSGLVSNVTPGSIANWYGLNGIVNQIDVTITPTAGHVLIADGVSFDNRALLSTDIPGIVTNSQTASYTLVLTDAGKLVELNVATSNTLTVPPNSAVAFPVGTVIPVRQYGAGTTTITPGSGVTVNSRGGLVAMAGTFAEATLTKRATNEWILSGDLA